MLDKDYAEEARRLLEVTHIKVLSTIGRSSKGGAVFSSWGHYSVLVDSQSCFLVVAKSSGDNMVITLGVLMVLGLAPRI